MLRLHRSSVTHREKVRRMNSLTSSLVTSGLYENLCGVGHVGIIACLLNLELSILLDSEALVKLRRVRLMGICYYSALWYIRLKWNAYNLVYPHPYDIGQDHIYGLSLTFGHGLFTRIS